MASDTGFDPWNGTNSNWALGLGMGSGGSGDRSSYVINKGIGNIPSFDINDGFYAFSPGGGIGPAGNVTIEEQFANDPFIKKPSLPSTPLVNTYIPPITTTQPPATTITPTTTNKDTHALGVLLLGGLTVVAKLLLG